MEVKVCGNFLSGTFFTKFWLLDFLFLFFLHFQYMKICEKTRPKLSSTHKQCLNSLLKQSTVEFQVYGVTTSLSTLQTSTVDEINNNTCVQDQVYFMSKS